MKEFSRVQHIQCSNCSHLLALLFDATCFGWVGTCIFPCIHLRTHVHDITLFFKQTSTCLMMFERSKFSGWAGTYKVLTCSELKSKLLEGLCNVVQVHATLKPFTERLTTFCHINNSAGNCFVRETFSNVSSWFACIVQAA